MKRVDSEHFDEQPAGDIFRHLARAAGLEAIVDSAIAAQMVGYRLRWNQSAGAFGKELAEELGATFKRAGGKLLVTARGSGRTASGAAIPPIVVPFSADHAFDLTIESRTEYKEIGGAWFDPLAGIRQVFEGSSIGQASRFLGLHPFPSETDAERAGKAYARELARKTVSGGFDMAGRADAQSGAPVIPQGYGAEIDALELVATSISHEITFDDDGGWLTSVEVESREAAG